MRDYKKLNLRIGILKLSFFFKLLLVSLKILHHQIFPRQLIVVSEMIYFLVRLKVKMVQYFVNLVSLNPQQIPVLTKYS